MPVKGLQIKENKRNIIGIGMELKLGKGIEKLEFMAEEDYQTNIMWLFTYLNCTWSLPAKCTKLLSLLTAYLVSGRLWPFALLRFVTLRCYHSYP